MKLVKFNFNMNIHRYKVLNLHQGKIHSWRNWISNAQPSWKAHSEYFVYAEGGPRKKYWGVVVYTLYLSSFVGVFFFFFFLFSCYQPHFIIVIVVVVVIIASTPLYYKYYLNHKCLCHGNWPRRHSFRQKTLWTSLARLVAQQDITPQSWRELSRPTCELGCLFIFGPPSCISNSRPKKIYISNSQPRPQKKKSRQKHMYFQNLKKKRSCISRTKKKKELVNSSEFTYHFTTSFLVTPTKKA